MQAGRGRWYANWQKREHAICFDFRSALDDRNLVRSYESFNDVRLLKERLSDDRRVGFLEVGCATGDFYRYLCIRYLRVSYYGVDISRPAVERAREKYPQARFFMIEGGVPVRGIIESCGLAEAPEIVYAKDVVQHQTKPFEFVSDLIQAASESVVFRCRTRDVGRTELDPELSCQYYSDGWVPYIVMNLDELIAHVRNEAPQGEVVVYRNHMVLGGRENRYLPKDCYLKETGTAETAVGVFKKSEHRGKVSIRDRRDQNPHYTLDRRLRGFIASVLRILRPHDRLARLWPPYTG